MSYSTGEASRFVGYLEWLLEESEGSRGAMAHLRRGLGKPTGTAYEMDRHILPKLPEGASSEQEDAYYLVASLFAWWHQGKDKADSTEGNLGKSLRQLVEKQVSEGANRDNAEKSIEKRLTALLNAHFDDLPRHLRQLISLLKSKEVSVNWAQLLHDLQYWDAENRFIQHNWSKGFWITPRGNKTEESTTPTEEETE